MQHAPRRHFFLSLAASALCAAASLAGAQGEFQPPSGAVTLGGRAGGEAWDGQLDLLVPLYQVGGTGIVFLDPRGSLSDGPEQELSLGVGVRRILPGYAVILGGNAYFDARWTAHNNQFVQWGLGGEILTRWVDARLNIYFPEEDKKLVGTEERMTFVDTTVRTTYYGELFDQGNGIWQNQVATVTDNYLHEYIENYEATMDGLDAEVGLRLPLPSDKIEARVFAGYYHFSPNFEDAEAIAGLKGRLELRVLPALLVDAEVFEDDRLAGTDYFVGARLRLPFAMGNLLVGKNPFKDVGAALKPAVRPFSERLAENVIRDPHIRTCEAAEVTAETVARLAGTRASLVEVLGDVVFVDNLAGSPAGAGTAENPVNTVQGGVDKAYGRNNVYVRATGTTYVENVLIDADVNLVGQGYPVAGGGGKTFGGDLYPQVNGRAVAETFLLDGAGTVTIRGLDIINTDGGLGRDRAVSAVNVGSFTAEKNVIRYASDGIRVFAGAIGSTAVSLIDNTLSNFTARAVQVGLGGSVGSASVLLSGNAIKDAQNDAVNLEFGDNAVASVAVSGNTIRSDDNDGIRIAAYGNAVVSASVAGNAVTVNDEFFEGIEIDAMGQAAVTATIVGNTLGGRPDSAIGLSVREQARCTAAVEQNTLTGGGIGIAAWSNAVCAVRVSGNTVSGAAQEGLRADAHEQASLDIAILGNSLAGNNTNGVGSGCAVAAADSSDACLRLQNNTSDTGFLVEQSGAASFGLEPPSGNTGPLTQAGVITPVPAGTCNAP